MFPEAVGILEVGRIVADNARGLGAAGNIGVSEEGGRTYARGPTLQRLGKPPPPPVVRDTNRGGYVIGYEDGGATGVSGGDRDQLGAGVHDTRLGSADPDGGGRSNAVGGGALSRAIASQGASHLELSRVLSPYEEHGPQVTVACHRTSHCRLSASRRAIDTCS